MQRLRDTIKAEDQLYVLHASALSEQEQVARETPTFYSPAVVWRAWLPIPPASEALLTIGL